MESGFEKKYGYAEILKRITDTLERGYAKLKILATIEQTKQTQTIQLSENVIFCSNLTYSLLVTKSYTNGNIVYSFTSRDNKGNKNSAAIHVPLIYDETSAIYVLQNICGINHDLSFPITIDGIADCYQEVIENLIIQSSAKIKRQTTDQSPPSFVP